MKNKLGNRWLKVYQVIEKIPRLPILTGLKSQHFLSQLWLARFLMPCPPC